MSSWHNARHCWQSPHRWWQDSVWALWERIALTPSYPTSLKNGLFLPTRAKWIQFAFCKCLLKLSIWNNNRTYFTLFSNVLHGHCRCKLKREKEREETGYMKHLANRGSDRHRLMSGLPAHPHSLNPCPSLLRGEASRGRGWGQETGVTSIRIPARLPHRTKTWQACPLGSSPTGMTGFSSPSQPQGSERSIFLWVMPCPEAIHCCW